MSEALLRQSEAWAFVQSIEDARTRLLTQVALGKAHRFLMTDPTYASTYASNPVDSLLLARTLATIMADQQVLGDILSGLITSIDDLNPFPQSV